MNFAYLVVFGFGLLGFCALLYDVPGLLLYHSKEKARVTAGKRYVKTRAQTKTENFSKGQYGKPYGSVLVKSAVFTYEEDGKAVRATAVNLLGNDNLYLDSGKIYTIKVSPFNPH